MKGRDIREAKHKRVALAGVLPHVVIASKPLNPIFVVMEMWKIGFHDSVDIAGVTYPGRKCGSRTALLYVFGSVQTAGGWMHRGQRQFSNVNVVADHDRVCTIA